MNFNAYLSGFSSNVREILAHYDLAPIITGGMLTTAKEHIQSINPDVDVLMFGQELNDETYAIAKSDFLLTGVASLFCCKIGRQ